MFEQIIYRRPRNGGRLLPIRPHRNDLDGPKPGEHCLLAGLRRVSGGGSGASPAVVGLQEEMLGWGYLGASRWVCSH
jgi:hypothetical protein